MLRHAILLLAAAPLAACGDAEPGTSISLNAQSKDGTTLATADGATGQVSIKAPGFEGALKLPKLHLDADDFEMNGVNLYPGSTISGLNIDAIDQAGGNDKGVVRVSFESPARPDTVRDWFHDRLGKAGFALTADGQGLVGTTEEGDPFRLALAPMGADRATGTITIRDDK